MSLQFYSVIVLKDAEFLSVPWDEATRLFSGLAPIFSVSGIFLYFSSHSLPSR